jgi:ferredoxin-NADP reductase
VSASPPDAGWTDALVRAVSQPARGVRALDLVPAEGAQPYTPGSHIEVAVRIAGTTSTRCYSLVGEAPAAGALRIAVKRLEDSRGGSRFMWSLRPGATLRISAPRNHFELQLGAAEYLLIAGGIGITPLYGMTEQLSRSGAKFRLLYAGRARAEMAYLSELERRLGARLSASVSEEGTRVDLAAEIERLDREGEIYVCGPLGLMQAARRAWLAAGRRQERFRLETFGASGQQRAHPFEVEVRDHRRVLQVARDQSLLDALGAAGIDVPGHCRRGECGLCAVQVLQVDGVLDHRDVFLSDQEKARGKALCACVSRAVGRLAIDTGYRS